MLGKPLLPQKCKSCSKVNKCFNNHCQYCSGDLKTPKRTAFQEDKDKVIEDIAEFQAQFHAKAMNNPDLSPNQIKQQILNQEDTP
jgi:hypothetical protein